MKIHFRELTKLSPTIISTVLKLAEETGELSGEVQKFTNNTYYMKCLLLPDLLGELMDVAQVTATLAFVLERSGLGDLNKALDTHIEKLKNRQYIDDKNKESGEFSIENGQFVLALPKLSIKPDLTTTFLKLTEETGELVQLIGKGNGLSGEMKNIKDAESMATELPLALLDVAQCCVTMLYILVEQYGIDVDEVIAAHEAKLSEHGYL